MNAKIVWIVSIMLIGGVVAPMARAAEEATQTLQGEIVDPAAYLRDGRHGAELEDETFDAVDGGQTLALLEQDTQVLYLLLAPQAGEDPNELVYDHVTHRVKLTGHVYERGGMHGIVATEVESLEPAAAPAAPANP